MYLKLHHCTERCHSLLLSFSNGFCAIEYPNVLPSGTNRFLSRVVDASVCRTGAVSARLMIASTGKAF